MAEKRKFYGRKKKASGYSHLGEFTLNYDSEMMGTPTLPECPMALRNLTNMEIFQAKGRITDKIRTDELLLFSHRTANERSSSTTSHITANYPPPIQTRTRRLHHGELRIRLVI